MMKGVMGLQSSYLTVIVLYLTMHLMHHNHCQIAIMCVSIVYTRIKSCNNHMISHDNV